MSGLFGPPQAQGICDRCKLRMNLVDMVSDCDSPGLRGHPRCMDMCDPWKLPPRMTEDITLQNPRPDERLVLSIQSPNPFDPPAPTPAPAPTPTPSPPSDGSQLFDTTFTDTGPNEPALENELIFNSDGTLSYIDNAFITHPQPNWFLPTTIGVGATHWVRVTQVSGPWGSGISYGGPALNTWVLASTAFIDITSNTIGHQVGVLKIEVSNSPTGPALVMANYTFDLTVTF